MQSGKTRVARWFGLVLLIYFSGFALIYLIDLEKVSFETPAIVGSIAAICMSILAVVLDLRSPKPSRPRTITITIEDSTGTRARLITRSDRRVEDVKRELERLVMQAS
ncbi:MAG TPA: hypothetical protein VHG08_17235 [Longimicrobium sp.]|nr:hypothetical protein [Longimicrobium sp.]